MAIEDAKGNMHSEENGQFTNKNSSKKAYDSRDDFSAMKKAVDSKTKKTPAENASVSKKKGKTKDEFFGEEFKGVKGKEAIETLLKEKRGHVKNAFERSEIGGIDLIWGDESGGLQHTIIKRDKKLAKGEGTISGYDMVMKIPEIMQKGIVDNDDKGRINIDYDGYRVGILPTIHNNKVNWIVTAMELL